MTLPSKGRRTIVLDEVEYHWLVRDNGDHHTIAIEQNHGEGQTLHITLSQCDYSSMPVVTPSNIVRLIKPAWPMDGIQPRRDLLHICYVLFLTEFSILTEWDVLAGLQHACSIWKKFLKLHLRI